MDDMYDSIKNVGTICPKMKKQRDKMIMNLSSLFKRQLTWTVFLLLHGKFSSHSP